MLLTPVYTTDLADHSSSLTAVHLSQRSLSNLHAASGVPLNTPCMRIIIWDGALRGHCSFVEFPVLVNVICRVLACVLKTCLHFKNNFLKNNPPFTFSPKPDNSLMSWVIYRFSSCFPNNGSGIFLRKAPCILTIPLLLQLISSLGS